MHKNHFTIAIDTYNHKDWIKNCLNTCLTQRYDNYEVILVDAISTDGTYEICKEYEKNFDILKVYQDEIRIPQVANILWLTKLAKAESIIVSIDGDDWLKGNRVLEKLNNVYNSKETWMTYGSYEEYPYRDVSFHYHAYPNEVIKNNTFREYSWVASHLRTWRRELFLKINENDFKIDNKWLDMTGDQAFMLPMLEMAGNKSTHIPEVLYIYNVANTNRDGLTSEARQLFCANYIRSLDKYKLINSLK